MTGIEKLGSAKRFGARYGRTVKHNFARIEKEQRALHKCPYCNNDSVKRLSAGIWECRKCNAKFAGKAYTISKKIVIKDEITVEPVIKTMEELKYQKKKKKEEEAEDNEEPEQQADVQFEENEEEKKEE